MLRLWTAISMLYASSGFAQISVNIYDETGIGEALGNAENEASRILMSGGVSATWYRCGAPTGGTCQAPGPNVLQVRLYPASAEARFQVESDAFGFALSVPPPQFGFFVGVFPHRAAALAGQHPRQLGVLLGHVFAHEIGHLLLGGGGHTADGIMSFPWRVKELERMRMGTLLFHGWQARAMRANVASRRSSGSQ